MRDMSSTSSQRAPQPERNLALELVRVTEAAAMAAGRWVGRGDKNDDKNEDKNDDDKKKGSKDRRDRP